MTMEEASHGGRCSEKSVRMESGSGRAAECINGNDVRDQGPRIAYEVDDAGAAPAWLPLCVFTFRRRLEMR